MSSITIWIKGINTEMSDEKIELILKSHFNCNVIKITNPSFGYITREQREYNKWGISLLWYICSSLNSYTSSKLMLLSNSLNVVKTILVKDASNMVDEMYNKISIELDKYDVPVATINFVCNSHDVLKNVNYFILNELYKKLINTYDLEINIHYDDIIFISK